VTAKKGQASNRMEATPAYVAYPAEYRSSGVMTFVIARDGTVFEKDLGSETARMAKAISPGSLDSGWGVVE